MRTIGAVLVVIFIAGIAGRAVTAQQSAETVNVVVKSAEGPVAEAKLSVRGTSVSTVSDSNGHATLAGLPAGDYVLEASADGFRLVEVEFTVPRSAELIIELEENESVVTISTTRTGREIDDTPTRVEAIDAEEIDEKSSMRPANVSMLLNESTGVKVQQTSATTFTQSIRIQGLDGRYTQLLKDGFPTFGGFSASLGVLDIPPLDLKQVEIIKGASSTFFGGGAIAGVVNFISKEPGERPQTSLILNQTSALGSDASVFHTRRANRFGLSLFGAFGYQRPYDADGDSFTELPLTYSFSADPKLFVYGRSSRLVIGNSTSFQSRVGGDLDAIGRGSAGSYKESHRSLRNVTTMAFEKDLQSGGRVSVKQSLAYFQRSIEVPGYRFGGRQINSFTEASVFRPAGKHFLVLGANAFFDKFSESRPQGPPRDESRLTLGVFVQDTVEFRGNSRSKPVSGSTVCGIMARLCFPGHRCFTG